jgi:beta-mannosidase
VWLNTEKVLHSENMFELHDLPVGALRDDNEIVMRFSALRPLLDERRPRPRWKTLLASNQNLRWFRTTLLGRQPGWAVTPAPVGPWKPVRALPDDQPRTGGGRLIASCRGDAGVVDVSLEIRGIAKRPATANLHVGTGSGPLVIRPLEGDGGAKTYSGRVLVEGSLVIESVERWWPHTHGSQNLLAAWLELDGRRLELGSLGFRTVDVEREDGGFRILVNGTPVFCRGGCWFPIDPVNMAVSDSELRATLELVVAANMNMLRIPGGTVYEDERFWDLCDELGILVWQDCMLGYLDPPDDQTFTRVVEDELAQVLGRLGRHPALAVLCGSQEIEEQAAFFGLSREKWQFPLTQRVIPEIASRLVPGVPYVSSSPTGGDQPSQLDVGVSHYFGVGSYLRDLEDIRSSAVRFVSEGLAFAIPPERETVDESCGGASRAGHDPAWKQAVHHDTGRSWDTEDLRDFYVGKLFGVDPHLVRYEDPERALDLGRAAVAEIMRHAVTEWRRPGSACAGALVVAVRDLVPGAGWGIVDALGRPKAPWFTLRRTLAPVAVLLTDEGLNGLRLHVLNDLPSAFRGEARVELYARGEVCVETATSDVTLEPHGAGVIEMAGMFDGFRDLSYAYRFGPPSYDVVRVLLVSSEGAVVSEVVHLPAGLCRPLEHDLGLSASVHRDAEGSWSLTVGTRRFAEWVSVDVRGFRPEDSWFHLAPGASRTLALDQVGTAGVPSGHVRALNAQHHVAIVAEG